MQRSSTASRYYRSAIRLLSAGSTEPVIRRSPCHAQIEYVQDRPGHDRRYAIDGTTVERELGFRTSIALDQGLAATVEWYVDHEPWWRSIKGGTYRRGLGAEPRPP